MKKGGKGHGPSGYLPPDSHKYFQILRYLKISPLVFKGIVVFYHLQRYGIFNNLLCCGLYSISKKDHCDRCNINLVFANIAYTTTEYLSNFRNASLLLLLIWIHALMVGLPCCAKKLVTLVFVKISYSLKDLKFQSSHERLPIKYNFW